MGTVRANGVDFFYQRMGEGRPTVVFVHGLVIDNLSSWWYTVANPAARHSEVLCYDLRGHGRSERPATGYSLAETVDDLCALLDTLGIDGPVQVVGNSYGGAVGLALAGRRPEQVAGLVLLEAHAPVEGDEDKEREQLVHGLELAQDFVEDQEVNDWVEQFGGRKLKRMRAAARELLNHTSLLDDLKATPPFTREELARVTCPVLLVYGEESDVFHRGELLADLLPDGRLEVVRGVDHDVLMGKTPQVRQLIVDWLAAEPVPAGPLPA